MNKNIISVILATVIFFAYILVTTYIQKMHKRKIKLVEELEEEFDEEEYYHCIGLHIESIRLLYSIQVSKFVDYILLESEKEILEGLHPRMVDAVASLLKGCIGCLVEETNYDEKSFLTVRGMLECCDADEFIDKDALDSVMDEYMEKYHDIFGSEPQYYHEYRKYHKLCMNEREQKLVISCAYILISNVVEKLYEDKIVVFNKKSISKKIDFSWNKTYWDKELFLKENRTMVEE